MAWPGGSWEFQRTEAGSRDSSVALGLRSKAAGTPSGVREGGLGRQDSWVPAQLCCQLAGQFGHLPSPFGLSFSSLPNPRQYARCFEGGLRS